MNAVASKKKIIFLCTANMYRSRLAEILFNHHAQADGLEWHAESRALSHVASLTGMSRDATDYLENKDLGELAEEPRDPITMTVEEFDEADLFIAMCRAEHQRLLKSRFISVTNVLEESGKLRYWNIYDTKNRLPWYFKIPLLSPAIGSQPQESGAEHVEFAVQALIREFSQNSP